MTDKLRQAVQAVIEAYDCSLEQDTHSDLAPHIKALHEAYADSSPPFHPSQLFTNGTTGSFTVNGFQLSFKDGELVGVNNFAEHSPIDALIADMDLVLQHTYFANGVTAKVNPVVIKAILDKYRS